MEGVGYLSAECMQHFFWAIKNLPSRFQALELQEPLVINNEEPLLFSDEKNQRDTLVDSLATEHTFAAEVAQAEDTPAYATLQAYNLLVTSYRKERFQDIFIPEDLTANSSQKSSLMERIQWGVYFVPGCGWMIYVSSPLWSWRKELSFFAQPRILIFISTSCVLLSASSILKLLFRQDKYVVLSILTTIICLQSLECTILLILFWSESETPFLFSIPSLHTEIAPW